MFYGSDDHASAAGNILSLVASCKLHDLDPEPYLCAIIKVLPYWPRDRYLELAPKYWPSTRARLDPCELERELGHIAVPPSAHAALGAAGADEPNLPRSRTRACAPARRSARTRVRAAVTTDQRTWTNAPASLQAKTAIAGLTVGTTSYFRFRGVTKEGEGVSWNSSSVSLKCHSVALNCSSV